MPMDGHLSDMNELIAAGNTQPGGFYRPCTPRPPRSSDMLPLGERTLKLYGEGVQQTVPEHDVPVVRKTETQGMRGQEWRLTDDMMRQPWGSVLRTLAPDRQPVRSGGGGSFGMFAGAGRLGSRGPTPSYASRALTPRGFR